MVNNGKGGLPTDQLLKAGQVAAVLSVSPKMVYKLASTDEGFPKPKRIGGRLLRWRASEVTKYIESTG